MLPSIKSIRSRHFPRRPPTTFDRGCRGGGPSPSVYADGVGDTSNVVETVNRNLKPGSVAARVGSEFARQTRESGWGPVAGAPRQSWPSPAAAPEPISAAICLIRKQWRIRPPDPSRRSRPTSRRPARRPPLFTIFGVKRSYGNTLRDGFDNNKGV